MEQKKTMSEETKKELADISHAYMQVWRDLNETKRDYQDALSKSGYIGVGLFDAFTNRIDDLMNLVLELSLANMAKSNGEDNEAGFRMMIEIYSKKAL